MVDGRKAALGAAVSALTLALGVTGADGQLPGGKPTTKPDIDPALQSPNTSRPRPGVGRYCDESPKESRYKVPNNGNRQIDDESPKEGRYKIPGQ